MKVSIVAKIKHAALRKAAVEMGSQSALARHLEVSAQDMGKWCNLHGVPPLDSDNPPRSPSKWTAERIRGLEGKLFALTGQLLIDLFPPELTENKAFLKQSKTIEAEADVEIAMLNNRLIERMLLPDPADIASANEAKNLIQDSLKTLSYREREILKLRYGLGGHENAYSYEEIGHIFKMTRERVRQIEAKAVRKLQQPSRADKLIQCL